MHTLCRNIADTMQTKSIPTANLAHMHPLVPYVKAAEALNLRLLATAPAALKPHTLLHAPHQTPNLIFGELIVPSVGYRQP